ncbi:MAG: tRNA (N6-isopentenyl adenosine(37)-C2)-methylthiotransferase MiaB [Erysipelotrichaceae bacterium]|nr:tRNA (N6-isopentenyl adenosine(37)-C2)-methylthiotransferase MiaB [Erysipelotrichaceae bacterium]MBQ1911241.1 tRNA (N6-isopentenyl adenosine(37)-C2)-methylthiotransferase MiaB [Erysipelotrichaceae bacterium]MBQ2232365.1 tRNA (N6-isopentenyl adenosine(37)-C2)-methylthiotransferase MiaB [Erysipelotrichaceae bacterium]MBQ5552444.1 tRNA (N6-isopentenyl adenosine(37)-C2)-methylthiotransferase MiaB [Erysipelotrichaceae bacterium]MBQ5555745.1 tRNA (N6-isopentenyl adenosine(37)-C2)-methylthiotransfe
MKKDYRLPSLNDARKRNKEVSEKLDFFLDPAYIGLGDGKKFYIITHGCQANQRDSETMAGLLNAMGYTMCDDEKQADVIIINTCAVRQGAEEKVLGEVGALKRLKTLNPDLIIGIGGCMAQEEETVKIIMEKYRQVDIVFGTHNITSLPKLIYEVLTTKKRKIEVFSKMGEIIESVPVTRFMSHKAWVNIMYGCDKFCSYCIVPYTRGKERSRYKEDIIYEVEELVKQGYKEVCLLGQNVNAYGKDLKIDYTFGNLLEDVAKTGIARIRFMTSHPWDFDDTMIQAIKNNKNIMPYIHLPIQSGNTQILKKMNRRYSREEYLALFDKLKAELPGFAFTTDIIVGFPNESDEAFEDTLSAVRHCEYDNAFTFIFSPREGTPAASMEDSIDRKAKEERLQRLNELVAHYANKNNQKFKDQVVEVLVDGLSKRNSNVYSGYTPENKLVNFTGNNVKVGDIVKVKITQVMSFSLNGEMVE